jgi:hypothetical protein
VYLLGYGQDDLESGLESRHGRRFSSLHGVQIGPGTHPSPCLLSRRWEVTLNTYFFLGTVAKEQWRCTALQRPVPAVGCSDSHFALCTEINCRVGTQINVNEMDYIADESSENMPTFVLENIVNSIPNSYRLQ